MHEAGLDMMVCTQLTFADGRVCQGPKLRISQGHRRPGGAFDWNVARLNAAHESVGDTIVYEHRLRLEPLLCLAARAAWSIWDEHAPMDEELEEYAGLLVEVTYGEDKVATISVELDKSGSRYTGSAAPCFELSYKFLDCRTRRNAGHWVRMVLNEFAFGVSRPLPQPWSTKKARGLPACWVPSVAAASLFSTGEPMTSSESRASLRRQSEVHRAFANAAARRRDFTSASYSVIQAGYCAALSMLSLEEVRSYPTHPNARAAALGAKRLGLSSRDQAFGERAAENFYASNSGRLWSVDKCFGWARRARAAARWNG